MSNDLTTISDDIKSAWEEARAHQVAALEGYLRVGHLLDQARSQLPSNAAYGEWFTAQAFGFSQQWGSRLRSLARNEAEVLRLSTTAVVNGMDTPGVNRLLELLSGRPTPTTTAVVDAVEGVLEQTLREVQEWADAHPEGEPIRITIPATLEEAVARLNELGERERRMHAAQAYLEALLPEEEVAS